MRAVCKACAPCRVLARGNMLGVLDGMGISRNTIYRKLRWNQGG
ncbi:MAG TPA: hypothetical protein VKI18_13530 [Albitalea sp.]|nr:hypothetical protein [Albitalea sp.]